MKLHIQTKVGSVILFFNSKILAILLTAFLLHSYQLASQGVLTTMPADYVSTGYVEGGFTLSNGKQIVPLMLSEDEFPGVIRVARMVQDDLFNVTSLRPDLTVGEIPSQNAVIVGTLGKSTLIDLLVEQGKVDVSGLVGKREISLTQVINEPLPGVDNALVIIGSDKRGTIYGLFDLSRNCGISPWYWWADVPISKNATLYIKDGQYITTEPKVTYRGIFLNDEAPALTGWGRAVFGGFNHKFYEKVFEVILRLKGNFLWPAMWGSAFFDDDPLNGPLADEMGIVIGTSHHEPMGRAHDEWRRYGTGKWDYTKNKKNLSEFWRDGMERMKDYETLVTIGMRGDGDEPMTEKANIALLERIVKDQRDIISKVTRKKTQDTPQVWALYKEVQDYYDNGMRVPDDVTLLLCDDNWGNVRKLPSPNEPERKGGYGMYYHFDYVGGPRNYKWINVSQVPRIWEQMNLAWEHGVDRIWVVNVGDLKPMEYPITFFLDMAWDPDAFNANNLFEHTVEFCREQFGGNFAQEAAHLINLYTKYNRRVTPELLDHNTYSLENYNEFERVTNEYKELLLDAFKLYYLMPAEYRDAYDQLVLFPIHGMANLYEMYYAVAMNHRLAEQNDPEANRWADIVQQCYDKDSLLTIHYNQVIANGKWPHMMDQIRIGYTYWQQPDKRVMPMVKRVTRPEYTREDFVYIEGDGYVAIEAKRFNRASKNSNFEWKVIPDLSKTLSGITTFHVNEYPAPNDMVYVEYDINFNSTGEFEVHVLVSPTLNFNSNKGLRYAVSINGGEENIVNFNKSYTVSEMEHWQANSINHTISKLTISEQGISTLRFRVLEPGIVLQKIMIDTGDLKDSYLGAPESKRIHREKLNN